MKFSKRLFSTLIGAALLGASTLAAAASYPEKPVTIVIPFSPGGATDTLGRILADKLHDRLGQPFIVENIQELIEYLKENCSGIVNLAT